MSKSQPASDDYIRGLEAAADLAEKMGAAVVHSWSDWWTKEESGFAQYIRGVLIREDPDWKSAAQKFIKS